MITVSEIRQKAAKKYADFLRYKINCYFNCKTDDDEIFFPLFIKADRGKANTDLTQYGKDVKPLIEKSKNSAGRGFSLEFEEVNTRNNGRQQQIKHIFFETEEDYLFFVEKQAETENLTGALKTLHERIFLLPQDLHNWALKHTNELVSCYSDETDFWENISLCANWLNENRTSNLYIREISLPVHTKFIETYKSLIHSFFPSGSASNFEELHGLRQKPYLVRFRTLDENPLVFGNIPITELSLSLQDFIQLETAEFLKNIQTVLIIENEMVYLTFPQMKNTLCVWGHGFTVTLLKQCGWICKKEILYFGDLDEHGFQILSDFRNFFSQTKSFCMDMQTLQEFDCFRCKGKVLSGNAVPQHLTKDEQIVFEELRHNAEKNRLEQERVSVEFIKNALRTRRKD